MKKVVFIIVFLLKIVMIAQQKDVIVSKIPAQHWHDAMVSGNGNLGIMVYGDPKKETIIVNHTKCWVPLSNRAIHVAELEKDVARARKKFAKGNIIGASQNLFDSFSNWNIQNIPKEDLRASYGTVKSKGGKDKVHPAFKIDWKPTKTTNYSNYTRETVLNKGEINIHWSDANANRQRNIFVSRPDNVIVWRIKADKKKKINGKLSITDQLPGKQAKYIDKQIVNYTKEGFYFFNQYAYTLGKPYKQGYHALGKLIVKGGTTIYTKKGVELKNANEVLLIVSFEYLENTSKANKRSLKTSINKLKPNYNSLLKRHQKVHGEMYNRVRVNLTNQVAKATQTEALIKKTAKEGINPEMLEKLFKIGRYALISSSGDFPPTLMGIWGATWNPAWTGHYTYDSNLQLAISGAASGNLPEVSQSYFNMLISMYPDWEENAKKIYGNRGYLAPIGSSWRKASSLNSGSWFSFTGAAGWLAAYYHEHYLCTGDDSFLRDVEIPLLKNTALFYEDFLKGMEDKQTGKYVFFPSISPESRPSKVAGADTNSYVIPNATSEIAICSFVLKTLIFSCNKFGIEQEYIGKWKEMLVKMPDYRINKDGALHEWSYPGIEGGYSNKHCSQFFGLYPGFEVNKFDTPKLYNAIRKGLKLRSKTKSFHLSGHGILHDCFFSIRLKNQDYLWDRLDTFVKNKFFYTSLLSAHFANGGVYNLDTSLALPAIILEMLVTSRPGVIELLPGVVPERLAKGNMQGMLTQAGVTIENLSWNLKKGTITTTLKSKKSQKIALGVPGVFKNIKIYKANSAVKESMLGENFKEISLKANESLKIFFTVK